MTLPKLPRRRGIGGEENESGEVVWLVQVVGKAKVTGRGGDFVIS